MILTHSQIRKILSDPDRLARLMPSAAEREGLAELGVTPLVDRLLGCVVTGQAYDSATDDAHNAEVKARAVAEQAEVEQKLDELADSIELRWKFEREGLD